MSIYSSLFGPNDLAKHLENLLKDNPPTKGSIVNSVKHVPETLVEINNLLPVHETILEYLKEEIPVKILQVSQKLHDELVREVYSDVRLNRRNIKQFLYAIDAGAKPTIDTTKSTNKTEQSLKFKSRKLDSLTKIKVITLEDWDSGLKLFEHCFLASALAKPKKLEPKESSNIKAIEFPSVQHIKYGAKLGIDFGWYDSPESRRVAELTHTTEKLAIMTRHFVSYIRFIPVKTLCFEWPNQKRLNEFRKENVKNGDNHVSNKNPFYNQRFKNIDQEFKEWCSYGYVALIYAILTEIKGAGVKEIRFHVNINDLKDLYTDIDFLPNHIPRLKDVKVVIDIDLEGLDMKTKKTQSFVIIQLLNHHNKFRWGEKERVKYHMDIEAVEILSTSDLAQHDRVGKILDRNLESGESLGPSFLAGERGRSSRLDMMGLTLARIFNYARSETVCFEWPSPSGTTVSEYVNDLPEGTDRHEDAEDEIDDEDDDKDQDEDEDEEEEEGEDEDEDGDDKSKAGEDDSESDEEGVEDGIKSIEDENMSQENDYVCMTPGDDSDESQSENSVSDKSLDWDSEEEYLDDNHQKITSRSAIQGGLVEYIERLVVKSQDGKIKQITFHIGVSSLKEAFLDFVLRIKQADLNDIKFIFDIGTEELDMTKEGSKAYVMQEILFHDMLWKYVDKK